MLARWIENHIKVLAVLVLLIVAPLLVWASQRIEGAITYVGPITVETDIIVLDDASVTGDITGLGNTVLGDNASAAESYGRAVELQPSYEVAWCNRANAFTYMGDAQQALQNYLQAIRVNRAYRVAYDGGFVRVRALAAECSAFYVFLGVVPRSACIGLEDGKHNARGGYADQKPPEHLDVQEPEKGRHAYSEQSGQYHAFERRSC